MKNVYIVETLETCKVWKQYRVDAYTKEDAKNIILENSLYAHAEELDHYIDHDLGVEEFRVIQHVGTTEEV